MDGFDLERDNAQDAPRRSSVGAWLLVPDRVGPIDPSPG